MLKNRMSDNSMVEHSAILLILPFPLKKLKTNPKFE